MSKQSRAIIGILAATFMASAAAAETPMKEALDGGAIRMTADQIAERLAGKTVTFQVAATGDKFLVYYDGTNGMRMQKVGTDKVFQGYYAVSTADHVCFGLVKHETPTRLRCVNVLLIDGKMHKFELDGSLRGVVVEEVKGNLM